LATCRKDRRLQVGGLASGYTCVSPMNDSSMLPRIIDAVLLPDSAQSAARNISSTLMPS
jgi:hypothetical protein